jgi:PAS domain S-box-containing protein
MELSRSEERLRLFIDRAPAAIAMFDAEMRYLAASRRFVADYGLGLALDPACLVGRSHYEVFPDIPERWRAIHRLVLGGETLSAEADPFPREDGRTDWIRWEMAPWYGPDGAIGGALLFTEVITARKQAEAALRRSEAELRGLNETLEARVRAEVAAREELQRQAAHAERMRALGQLAGGIAHDFNNVLQVIEGATALIRRQKADAGAVERMVRLATNAVDRGASITRRLLAFGRRAELRAEALDAAAFLGDLREMLIHTLGRAIEVDVRLADGVPAIFADKGQLETALVNLSTNARDAMPGGGRLTIAAEAETVPAGGPPHPAALAPGGYVRITVADTGTGMDEETLARAAEPFFTTKGPGSGTGLGVPMAMGFAEQSGGAVSIASSPGKGTTVTLWLPAARSAEAAKEERAPQRGQGEPSVGARVLLVDDEEVLREVLAEQLAQAGYSVLVAGNGAEAIALLEAGEVVDALVTDLSMPGMDGLAVIRAARQIQPGLPAVLLTGYGGDGMEPGTEYASAGEFSPLRKPIRLPELTRKLQSMLEAAGHAAGAPREDSGRAAGPA